MTNVFNTILLIAVLLEVLLHVGWCSSSLSRRQQNIQNMKRMQLMRRLRQRRKFRHWNDDDDEDDDDNYTSHTTSWSRRNMTRRRIDLMRHHGRYTDDDDDDDDGSANSVSTKSPLMSRLLKLRTALSSKRDSPLVKSIVDNSAKRYPRLPHIFNGMDDDELVDVHKRLMRYLIAKQRL